MPIREDPPPVQPEPEPAFESSIVSSTAPETEAPVVEPAPAEDVDELEPELTPEVTASDTETVVETPPPIDEVEVVPSVPRTPPTEIPTPKPILTRQRQSLTYGIASDVGILRDNNEDACFGMQWHSITVDDRPDFGLFIVADGMGGHLDGERASGVAVQTLAAEMLDSIYVPMLKDFNAGSSPTILEALVNASEKANRPLGAMSAQKSFSFRNSAW